MTLVDTSIWIDHIRARDERVTQLLHDRAILMHAFVLGELALGTFKRRENTLQLLAQLKPAKVAEPDEVFTLIDRHQLQGSGIGYVDAHLLASAALTPGSNIWTRDKRLEAVARSMSLHSAARLH